MVLQRNIQWFFSLGGMKPFGSATRIKVNQEAHISGLGSWIWDKLYGNLEEIAAFGVEDLDGFHAEATLGQAR